jgi:hypothetical protein
VYDLEQFFYDFVMYVRLEQRQADFFKRRIYVLGTQATSPGKQSKCALHTLG